MARARRYPYGNRPDPPALYTRGPAAWNRLSPETKNRWWIAFLHGATDPRQVLGHAGEAKTPGTRPLADIRREATERRRREEAERRRREREERERIRRERGPKKLQRDLIVWRPKRKELAVYGEKAVRDPSDRCRFFVDTLPHGGDVLPLNIQLVYLDPVSEHPFTVIDPGDTAVFFEVIDIHDRREESAERRQKRGTPPGAERVQAFTGWGPRLYDILGQLGMTDAQHAMMDEDTGELLAEVAEEYMTLNGRWVAIAGCA